jgi:acyl carrier protein
MSNISERVKKVIAKQLNIDETKVLETASFVDDLGADSLDQVEVVMGLEEEFGCEIHQDVAEKITTVAEAVNFIQSNVKAA